MTLKLDPMAAPNADAAAHVKAVQVTNGWTTLVNFLGNLAPYTNVQRVVLSRNKDVNGDENDKPILDKTSAIIPLMTLNA